jgi:hypothetical protein
MSDNLFRCYKLVNGDPLLSGCSIPIVNATVGLQWKSNQFGIT